MHGSQTFLVTWVSLSRMRNCTWYSRFSDCNCHCNGTAHDTHTFLFIRISLLHVRNYTWYSCFSGHQNKAIAHDIPVFLVMRGSLSRMRSKNIHASILCKAFLVNKVQKTSEAPPVYLIKRHKNQNYSTVLLLTNMIIRRSFSHIKLPRSLNLKFNILKKMKIF